MAYQHDAFISFAWPDLPKARRLHETIAAKGFDVWYAERNLRIGDELVDSLNAGLAKSRYLLVVHSKHFDQGKYAKREVGAVLNDEIQSGIVKVICLKFDDTPLPPLLSSKLFVDFSGRKPKAIEKVLGELAAASGSVIESVKREFLAATDVNAIRECAHRLSKMARDRNEFAALHAASEILLSVPENYNVGDSAAWLMGDIGVWSASDEMADEVMKTLPLVIDTHDARLINHMAYISGEMAKQAKNTRLKDWAAKIISVYAAAADAIISGPFQEVQKRIHR